MGAAGAPQKNQAMRFYSWCHSPTHLLVGLQACDMEQNQAPGVGGLVCKDKLSFRNLSGLATILETVITSLHIATMNCAVLDGTLVVTGLMGSDKSNIRFFVPTLMAPNMSL